MNKIEGGGPRPIGQIVPYNKRRSLIRIGRFADQDDRIINISEFRAPQNMWHKGELLEGPKIVVEDLASALISHPHHNPRTLSMELVQQHGQLSGALRAFERMEFELGHGKKFYSNAPRECHDLFIATPPLGMMLES